MVFAPLLDTMIPVQYVYILLPRRTSPPALACSPAARRLSSTITYTVYAQFTMSITRLTIRTLQNLFKSKNLTPTELSSFCHALAASTNPSFNIFSKLTPLDTLLQHAYESEQRYKEGNPRSMLEGIPISIKSNIAVKGFQLTANSNILGNTPGYDCVLIQKLKNAGAIIIGQTNMDEFGMGSLGNNSNNGSTLNPIPALRSIPLEKYIKRIRDNDIPSLDIGDLIYSPGGSSSGSAASVSMGTSIVSIGTDTGGSIRLPAAWCGVVGLKPSYGAISRHGVVSYASSLDTVGILGSSSECVSLTFDIVGNTDMEGRQVEDIRDSTSFFLKQTSDCIDEKSATENKGYLYGLKVGIPSALSVDACSDQVKDAWKTSIAKLEEYGATVQVISEEISSETVKLCLPAYYVLSCAEASSNLSRYDGLRYGLKDDNVSIAEGMNQREEQYASSRSIGFGDEVKRRILAGTAVLSSDRFHSHYEGATNVRAAVTREFNKAFRKEKGRQGVDLMMIPTANTGPPALGQTPPDSTEAFQNDIMTIPISLAGIPSVSVPIWTDTCDKKEGKYTHPVVGMQLIGPRLSEKTVLRVAGVLEKLSTPLDV